MPSFLVRTQLHQEDDYLLFHSEMENRGFSRTIKCSDGVVWDLPQGTYCIDAAVEISTVIDAAKQAAAGVQSKAKIIVVEAQKIMWSGLDSHHHALKDALEILKWVAPR